MHKYNKTIAALVTGLLGWGGVVITSTPTAVTAAEWLALGVAMATALGVYAIANEPMEDGGQAWAPMLLVFLIGFILGALCHAAGILVG